MKNFLTKFLLIFLVLNSTAIAEEIDCFVAKEGDKKLVDKGENCDVRYSPASTFKIPLAVIGFESGLLKDENNPVWQSKEPVAFLSNYWSGQKAPLTWMRYSVVWYSQMLTKKLGMKKFQQYVDRLNYGNRDLSGGLTEAWLSSSLKISPNEQLNFIESLAKNQLPTFSKKSQEQTKNLIQLFEESQLSNGWNIYGKTGSDIDRITGARKAYFVGYATKENRVVSFVIHISGDKNRKISGVYAKKIAMNEMLETIFKE